MNSVLALLLGLAALVAGAEMVVREGSALAGRQHEAVRCSREIGHAAQPVRFGVEESACLEEAVFIEGRSVVDPVH